VTGAHWLEEIDSLAFTPAGHEARCVVHRRAFRVLLHDPDPTGDECLAYFAASKAAFARAAAAKIAARGVAPGAAFHLNSRDVRRALAAEPLVEPSRRATGDEPEQG
jgi:hypothetical protein